MGFQSGTTAWAKSQGEFSDLVKGLESGVVHSTGTGPQYGVIRDGQNTRGYTKGGLHGAFSFSFLFFLVQERAEVLMDRNHYQTSHQTLGYICIKLLGLKRREARTGNCCEKAPMT